MARLLLLSALAFAGLAGPAQAATVSVAEGGSRILVTGTADRESINLGPDRAQLRRPAFGGDVTPGPGCRPHESIQGVVVCDVPAATPVAADLADGDDRLFASFDVRLAVTGGPGNDSVSTAGAADVVIGGPGNDSIIGGAGADAVDGGEGNDYVEGELGRDQVYGGPGDDSVNGVDRQLEIHGSITVKEAESDTLACGEGRDAVLATTGDSLPRDCEVTDRWGGLGPNLITGDRRSDRIRGTGSSDSLAGGGGADELLGYGASDRLRGGTGDDLLRGGTGDDRIDGGRGRDVIDGEHGDDTVVARDGERDVVACGMGDDRVIADRRDRVGRDCEVVRRARE